MTKILKIEIKGHAMSGKSSVARAIREALGNHGIKAEITGVEDETPEEMDATWPARIRSLAGASVIIETIQIPRGEVI